MPAPLSPSFYFIRFLSANFPQTIFFLPCTWTMSLISNCGCPFLLSSKKGTKWGFGSTICTLAFLFQYLKVRNVSKGCGGLTWSWSLSHPQSPGYSGTPQLYWFSSHSALWRVPPEFTKHVIACLFYPVPWESHWSHCSRHQICCTSEQRSSCQTWWKLHWQWGWREQCCSSRSTRGPAEQTEKDWWQIKT